MKKVYKTMTLSTILLFVLGCTSLASTNLATKSAENVSKMEHEVELSDAPKVFFTKDVSSQGLLKVYKALNQNISGKTGVKVSFGSDGEQYLDPKLMTSLIKETSGTFLDACGFTSPRHTPEGNLLVAKKHGFAAVGPIDIIDADGDIDMPLTNGYHLRYARTGSHLNDYDTLIAVHRFKMHYLPMLGGNIKNISLCLGSISGKAIIHSAGSNETSYEGKSDTVTSQAFADATKAALDFKKGRWAFLNVLDSFDPNDRCEGAKNLGNIGIVASLDPVAIDQASADFVLASAPNDKVQANWKEAHNLQVLEYAEKLGAGKRHYQLIDVDKK